MLYIQYIPRNMHTVFALLCFVVVINWLISPYPPGLLHWHCGNLTIAPLPAKQPWWIWINTSCEFIMNDCTTTTKQNTTKPCAYFLGCTVQRQYPITNQYRQYCNISPYSGSDPHVPETIITCINNRDYDIIKQDLVYRFGYCSVLLNIVLSRPYKDIMRL